MAIEAPTCKTHSACHREFRISAQMRDFALSEAFRLDIHSPKASIPGRFPYRWEVRKVPNLLVFHVSPGEEYWYWMDQDEDGQVPGLCVHVMVMLKASDRSMVPSADVRRHDSAESVFRLEMLRSEGRYTVVPDDLEQDKELLRQEMDEFDLPESWR